MNSISQLSQLLQKEANKAYKMYKEYDDKTECYLIKMSKECPETHIVKDYTGSHCKRVAELVKLYSERKMGCTKQEAIDNYNRAYLHDIGKTAYVSIETIAANSKLTDEQFKEIKSHVDGMTLLPDKLKEDIFLVAAVEGHHDYPGNVFKEKKLEQNAIISEFRKMITVADCLDAISSDRPYNKRDSLTSSFAKLRKPYNGRVSVDLQTADKVEECINELIYERFVTNQIRYGDLPKYMRPDDRSNKVNVPITELVKLKENCEDIKTLEFIQKILDEHTHIKDTINIEDLLENKKSSSFAAIINNAQEQSKQLKLEQLEQLEQLNGKNSHVVEKNTTKNDGRQ